MHVSPVLAEQTTYPFVRIEEAKRRKAAEGVRIFDFGMGDPREPTDPLIKRALTAALDEASGYPAAVGLPELRDAIAAWTARRFGVELDPERELIPTYGSKEAIFLFAQVVLDAGSGKDVVLLPDPAYPVYERGARFAGAEVRSVPLLADHDFLPDLDAVDDETWARASLLWLCYPNNPTGAVAPLSFYEQVVERALEHDVLVCSDEAYSELWFDEPPASALQVARPAQRRRLQHALEALVDDRLPLRLRRRRRGRDRVAAQVPAERRHRAAGLRPARGGRGVERRGARRAQPRALRPQAASASSSSSSARA